MFSNNRERIVLDILDEAQRDNDTDILISVYALLNRHLEEQGKPGIKLLSSFTRGQYKRAIKCLRESKALALSKCDTAVAIEYGLSAQYIRERCLNRKAVQA